MQTLSVLMPVFNESATLELIVERVLNAPVDLDIELICVDDGSTDNSVEILERLASQDDRTKVSSHPRNVGKGHAIRTAIARSTGDVAIVQDADLEYDPNDYPRIPLPFSMDTLTLFTARDSHIAR